MGRSNYIKILYRLIVLLAFGFIFNIIYVQFFWDRDLDENAQMLLDLKKEELRSEVLYFGESSNFSYHPLRDSLEDRISDFISYHFPELTFGTINHSAYHAGIYVPLIQQISENSKVETVIVTLNMRTFDQAAIHSPLESALQQDKVLFEPRPPVLSRLYMTLKNYDNTPEIERDLAMWKQWTFDTLRGNDSVHFAHPTIRSWCAVEKFPLDGGGEDMSKRALADHYIKAYAFKIDESNPRIKNFDEIVRIASGKNIKLVFNLLAENTQYADSLVGSELVWLMRENRDFLVDRYESQGVIVVDNLELVDGYHYTDQDWTTEHYDQIGRQKIAANVASSMKKLYPLKYKERQIFKTWRSNAIH